MKKCLININGGLGKNVMFTSILPIIAKEYDEIYIVSPYFELFKACSYVTNAFAPGLQSAGLHAELVKDLDCKILWGREPYNNENFIRKSCHLFDAWLEELGIEKPENFDAMSNTPILDQIAEEYPNIKKFADQKAEEIKKFIIVQFCGGQSPLAPQVDAQGKPIPYDDHAEPIKRNYYRGQQLIDKLREKHPDCAIIHYALPNEPSYDGAIKLDCHYLVYPLLAEKAEKIVCTDSSLQHLSTGRCRNMTVIWGETRPEHFGYKCNKNICAKDVKDCQPYFQPLGVSPSIVNMPKPDEVLEVAEKE